MTNTAPLEGGRALQTMFLTDVVSALVDSDYAIFEVARDGTIVGCTRSAERIYALTAEAMVGRPFGDLAPAEFKRAEQRWLERVVLDGRAIGVETERVGSDGRRRIVSLNLIPLRNESAALVGAVAIERDLGSGALTEIEPAVEKQDRSIGAFTAMSRTSSGRSQTILVVDDDPLVLRATCLSLKRAGYVAIGAANGAQALRVVEEYDRPIDLVLSDIVMPEMNGRELWAEIRTYHPRVRFMFMSGTEQRAELADPFGGGPVRILPKPVGIQILLSEVRRVLDDDSDADSRSLV